MEFCVKDKPEYWKGPKERDSAHNTASSGVQSGNPRLVRGAPTCVPTSLSFCTADHRNWTCTSAVYHYGSGHCARLQGLQCRRSYPPHADDPHKYGAWNQHVPGNHCLAAVRVRLDTARALTVAWKVIESSTADAENRQGGIEAAEDGNDCCYSPQK